jgi:thioesterase domain-containing protein
MGIKISQKLTLPDAAVTWKCGLLGRTGSGKTNTAVVMAEQMIQNGDPVAILDPQGDWWGLRSKYKIVILGGEHADIPLEPSGGTVAADFLINERIPVLFDLFTMGEGEMVRFAGDFAKRLWQANRGPLHIFLDEADLFAPQNMTGKGGKAVCLGAWQNIVRRGRSRGLGCTMITQRSAVINKDLLTQADPLFVHRLTAPQDLEAVKRYLDFHGQSRDQIKQTLSEVAKLKVGECFVISPGTLEIEPTKLSVLKRKSFDSSATPESGQSIRSPKSFADVDLSALKSQMADTIERAKANDPKELKKKIARLEKDLKSQAPVADEKAIERAKMDERKHWQGEIRKLQKNHESLTGKLSKINALSQMNGDASIAVVEPPKLPAPMRGSTVHRPVHNSAPKQQPSSHANGDVQLSKPERAIIQAFYWLKDEQANKAKIGFYSGYSMKSSGLDKAISSLRTRGFVSGWAITDEGESFMVDLVEPKPGGEELREWLRPKIGKPANVVLDSLIERYPDRLRKEEVAELSGYSDRSSGLDKALSFLRTIEAASGTDRDGGTIAADVFFE